MKFRNLWVSSLMMLFTGVASASIYTDYCHIPAFLILGTGASFSNSANISASRAFWDPAEQGYNARLGTSEFYTAGLGLRFTPLVSADVEYTYRPSFSYSKYQTPTAGASSTPAFLGTKTRYFDLENSSIMANLLLDGQGLNWVAAPSQNTCISPILGVGAGVAYNTMSNFHSVLLSANSVTGGNNVGSVMDSNTSTAFAWQALAGVEMRYKQNVGVQLGYRYFNGGTFHSNNYIQAINGTTMGSVVPTWKGRLTANEVFLNFKYYIV